MKAGDRDGRERRSLSDSEVQEVLHQLEQHIPQNAVVAVSHYQKGNQILFRYDNSSHHPHLANFPYHKHTADGEVIPAALPGLCDILREIDSILY